MFHKVFLFFGNKFFPIVFFLKWLFSNNGVFPNMVFSECSYFAVKLGNTHKFSTNFFPSYSTSFKITKYLIQSLRISSQKQMQVLQNSDNRISFVFFLYETQSCLQIEDFFICFLGNADSPVVALRSSTRKVPGSNPGKV